MPTPHVAVAAADSTTWKTLVQVQGASGTLTGLGVAAGPYYHHVRVTLDGRHIAEDVLAGTGSSAQASNGIGVHLPFADEMVVAVRDSSRPSAGARYWVAYVTDDAQLLARDQRVVDVGGRQVLYEAALWRTDEGMRFEIVTALGPALLARVRLDDDTLVSRPIEREGVAVELRGEVRLEATDAEPVTPEAIAVDVRPVGRTRIFARIDATDVGGAGGYFEGTILLPARGDFEVVTRLEAYANLPTSFLVL